jgi:hypothetical protein
MAFDPSVIREIGESGPDVTGSIAKGLTLADLYDQTAIRRGAMREKAQEQKDMEFAKGVLSKADLTNPEAQNRALAEITKRSPQLGMRLMKDFQSAAAGKAENDRAQLELYQAKNEIIGTSLVELKTKHDQIAAQYQQQFPKATPQEIERVVHDQMQNDVLSRIEQISKATLPNGQPVLNEQDRQQLKQGLGGGYNRQFVDALVARSQQARQVLAQKLGEQKEQRAERKEERDERRLELAEQGAAFRRKNVEEGLLEPEDARFMAEQYLAGDKSVMTGLGRGAQGAKNIITVRKAIREVATERKMSPTDLAAKLAEYNGYVAEQRALGTRLANIETASTEARKMIGIARQASADYPRTGPLHWEKLAQLKDTEIQDPKLAKLKGAVAEVVNTWARAISPSGVPTVADKEHGYALLNAAQSNEAFNAQLDQFQAAIDASLQAPTEVKQALHDAFVRGQGGPGSPAPGGATPPAPPPGVAPSGAGGTPSKVVHWDDLK